jgi:hypothetical protein
LALREVRVELTLASKKVITKYNNRCDSIQIRSAQMHTDTQSMTKQKEKESISIVQLLLSPIHFFKSGRCYKLYFELKGWAINNRKLLIKARPPKLHLLLSMTTKDDFEDQRTTINTGWTKSRVHGTPRQHLHCGHDIEDTIITQHYCGIRFTLERINMRGNHDALKKDMTPERDIFISFHPVPQEQIQAPPRSLNQCHIARRHHCHHS